MYTTLQYSMYYVPKNYGPTTSILNLLLKTINNCNRYYYTTSSYKFIIIIISNFIFYY